MGGKKKKKAAVYRNYGTFRLPDLYYNVPYTGKAKIIYDISKIIKTPVPPGSNAGQQNQNQLNQDTTNL